MSTFHQYACFNIKHHACNTRGSSQIYKRLCRKNENQFLEMYTAQRERGGVKEMISFSALHGLIVFTQLSLRKKVTSVKTKCATPNALRCCTSSPVSLNVKIVCL